MFGHEGSGVIVAAGLEVTRFRVGDAVYGIPVEKPFPKVWNFSFAAEYAVVDESLLLPKPSTLSFEEAASLPGFVLTAIQTFERGLQLRGEKSLEGKTVLVPGGLSGTGSVALQVAKNVFGAEKLITTVSTPKMPLMEQYLPGVADEVIDYTKQRVQDVVPRGSVDFMYNTQWTSMDQGIPVLDRQNGTIASIAGIPSKELVMQLLGPARVPWWLRPVLDVVQLYYVWKLLGTSIKYVMVSGSPQIREDLERAGEIIARGQVKAVMTVASLDDLEAVRDVCGKVASGKGGLGKAVIKII